MQVPFDHDTNWESMIVRDVMHPNVLCVPQSMPVRKLYAELQANEITGAPVLDENDYLIGVVSLTDIARAAQGKTTALPSHFAGYDVSFPHFDSEDIDHEKTVKDIMSQKVHKVAEDAELAEALELMTKEDIHRVVVTHRDHVVGIITSGDMMKLFLKTLKAGEDDE